MTTKKEETLVVRMDKEELSAVKRAAESQNLPVSIFVRQTLKRRIEDLPSHVESTSSPPERKA